MDIINESQSVIWQELLIKTTHSMSSGDNKCNQFLSFTLCFYFHRSCEPYNTSDPASGFQLKICSDKCADVDKLYQECTSKINIEAVVGNLQFEVPRNHVSVAMFKCSNPETYIIPHVNFSNKCDDVKYITHLFSSEGKQ